MTKISVVMPAKNRGNLIGESIKSIIDQTISDWELIIVDDHSDPGDDTEQVAATFNDSRIKFFRLPDLNGMGIAAARNFGNMVAVGEYIAVADSDDLCYRDRLELTLNKFSGGADVVYGVIDLWHEDTGVVKIRDDEYAARDFDKEYFKKFDFIPHPTVSYRRQMSLDFPYNSFFSKAEDYDLLSRFCEYGYIFAFIDKPIVRYRLHSGSTASIKSDGIHYENKVKSSRSWK